MVACRSSSRTNAAAVFGYLGVLGVLALLAVYVATQVAAIRLFGRERHAGLDAGQLSWSGGSLVMSEGLSRFGGAGI